MRPGRVIRAVFLSIAVVAALLLAVEQIRYVQAQNAADNRLREAAAKVLPGLTRLPQSRPHWTATSYIAAARQIIQRSTAGHSWPIVELGTYSGGRHVLDCTRYSALGRADFCSIPIPTLPQSYLTINGESGTMATTRYRLHFVSVRLPRDLQRQGFRGVLTAGEPFHASSPFSP